ncbi:UxaA family hydrolase [Paracandidimonas soli]|uniref:D-altronate dehydratase n=1 Tax=Paracandidimonas soli TaxID=1917182 RepID=A0A4R3V7R5_9BURK|nr:altronate dehydratase family protein [Paracandidimonas soli]TCU98424.1 D-altronate dehydratase [Paracandidimonas soli]
MQNSYHFIRLDQRDNVIVARDATPAGTQVAGESLTLLDDVPAGHKIATRAIARGDAIRKYNTVLGYAGCDIEPGAWLHNHNIVFSDVEKDYRFGLDYVPTPLVPEAQRARFMGYRRGDGRVGTRNYVGVFMLGGAGAVAVRRIARGFGTDVRQRYPGVDGVVPFAHAQGRGVDLDDASRSLLYRTLGGYIGHANIGGALLVVYDRAEDGLDDFLRSQGLHEGDALRVLELRTVGDIEDAVMLGRRQVEDMLSRMGDTQREPADASHLAVALQCGGSDGFSGLSANPALGAAMDILVRHGGSAILSETSEVYGAEHMLTARAVTAEVGKRLVDCIQWWLDDNAGRDTQINGKVGPGNNAGGITNIIEKSLGGAKKAGSTGLMDVLAYGERLRAHGFVFMDTPGNDPVSVTGQIAGGANLVCFTTGRGSCFGSFPAPTVKLSSNTPMFMRMQADMDINCGQVIDGDLTIPEMGERIFEQLLRHASGEMTKSEALGVGASEFIPWTLRSHD